MWWEVRERQESRAYCALPLSTHPSPLTSPIRFAATNGFCNISSGILQSSPITSISQHISTLSILRQSIRVCYEIKGTIRIVIPLCYHLISSTVFSQSKKRRYPGFLIFYQPHCVRRCVLVTASPWIFIVDLVFLPHLDLQRTEHDLAIRFENYTVFNAC